MDFQVLEKMKKICNIYDQLKKIIHFSGGEQRETYDDMKFSRCLAKAHFLNTARLLDFRTRLYKVLTSKMESQIHPSSTLFNSPPDVVIFYEILETKKILSLLLHWNWRKLALRKLSHAAIVTCSKILKQLDDDNLRMGFFVYRRQNSTT